jgi:uncharacterized membrane protein (UPF0127 family)
MRRQVLALVALVFLVVAAWLVVAPPLALVDPGTYDRATLTVYDADGEKRATIDVRVADTRAKRRVGLSRTDALANDTGMLFVHPDAGTHTYVMRNMSFPLDIVFVAPNGTITEIHHAPVDGGSYDGRGQYVLEVRRGWTTETGVGTGGIVEIPDDSEAGG